MTNALDVNELAGEVADSNFADNRLNARLRNLVSSLAEAPKKSLPKALDSAGLEGAYRFLSNHRVTPNQILSSHFSATIDRCEREQTVLIVHDSTSFAYRYDGEREGLGRARRGNKMTKQNFFAHFSLALTSDGERRPLGVVGFEPWSRAEAPSGTEYQRWEEQIRATSRRCQKFRVRDGNSLRRQPSRKIDHELVEGTVPEAGHHGPLLFGVA